MGAWGTKLYQDDTAMDVKDGYTLRLKQGKSNEEAVEELKKYNLSGIGDHADAVFWFALADCQWNAGRLMPEVKEKALEFLESGVDLEIWEESNPKLVSQRIKVLEELKTKLLSPQPPEKNI